MKTELQQSLLQTRLGQEANDILRGCVHCGFCTATCPTYQLLGDELDGPRGRIYLIKAALENNDITEKTQNHLDRCLSCGACETTCPSGVKYRRLLDIGREYVEEKVDRSITNKLFRRFLSSLITNKKIFTTLLRLAQNFRPMLPQRIKNTIPQKRTAEDYTNTDFNRKVILFRGCVHDAIAPEINSHAIEVLNKLGISVIEVEELQCCGAINHHLSEKNKTENTIKHNIDLLLKHMQAEVEAIFTTASACSLMLKDYPTQMQEDPEYHEKALQLANKFMDISEIVEREPFDNMKFKSNKLPIAFHNPCSMQHGLKLKNNVEKLLIRSGYNLLEVQNAHLCCGSAGTYSILQNKISRQLLDNKISSLVKNNPDIIVTANIGCLSHIESASDKPVKHWISLFNQSLN